MSEFTKYLKEKLDHFKRVSDFKDVFLFSYNKNTKKFRPELQLGHSNPVQTTLTLKKSVAIKTAWLRKSEAVDPEIGKIFKTYDLHYLSAPVTYNSKTSYCLGLRADKYPLIASQEGYARILFDFFESKLQSIRLKDELDRYAQKTDQIITELGALHEINRAIDSSHNLDTLLNYIVKKSMQLINAESGSLMLILEETNELEFKVALGPKSGKVKPFRLPIGKGISGWVAEHSEAILIPDAYADPRFDPTFDKRSGYRTRSFLCVPLIHKGKTTGVMTVLNRMDGQPFNENDKNILTTFASQAALAIENAVLIQAAMEKERLDKELEVASQIQHLLLPQEIPPVISLQVAATYIPCKAVGGDFYDIIPLKDDKYMFVVADVSGKGVPGALLVSSMQAALIAYLEYVYDLTVIASKLNDRIRENTSEDRYITAFMAIFDAKNATLSYINAGHNPPLFIHKNGKVEELRKGGVFLGFVPWQYETGSINLEEDDIVFMYTDGLVEAMNERDEEFGQKRLQKILLDNMDKSAEKVMQLVIDGVNKHTKGTHLEDDFTLLVLKKKQNDNSKRV